MQGETAYLVETTEKAEDTNHCCGFLGHAHQLPSTTGASGPRPCGVSTASFTHRSHTERTPE